MSESVLDKDQTSNDGIWDEAAERLEIAIVSETQNRTKGVQAKRFRWGEQWPDDISNARRTDQRPALTINHTNVMCQRQENTLRQQRPRIKVHPVGDGADIPTAKVLQGLIRHIENRSFASIAYDRGAKDSIDIGWGYWRVRADYLSPTSFDQELIIEMIRNAFRVYIDPAAEYPDGRDQGWCILSDDMKRAEYKRKYPKASNADYIGAEGAGDAAYQAMSDRWENKLTIRLAEYYRRHEVADTLIMMNDGQTIYESELPKKKIGAAMGWVAAVNHDGQEIKRQSSRLQVEWFRLNGKTIVDRRIIPGKYIPVVRVEGNVEELDGKILRKGMVEDLIDPARMFNYWRTSQTERYALAPKAPWVAAEGQLDDHPEWNDANRKSYSTLIYKPVTITTSQGDVLLPPPVRQNPAPVEDGMAQAAAGAEHDLMAVSGMPQENPELQARIVGGNKYLQRRQGMQDLSHFQYYDNQTLAIAWTGCLLLEQIPSIYDTQRMQRIIGENEQPQIVPINEKSTNDEGIERIKNDLTVGLYSVVMDTGPDYMTARQEGAENMIETLNTPLGEVIVQEGADVVLRNLDWKGADELADRVAMKIPEEMQKIVEGLPDQAKNIIGSLQQQLQQAQQTIQQQGLEIKYQAGKEQLKISGTLEKTDRDNETKLRLQSMKDSTSRDVAEIHGATQLLNTKAESEHEDRAAQKLIDAGVKDRPANGAA